MIKFPLYFDKDAETIWLNELAAKGWAMISLGYAFAFFIGAILFFLFKAINKTSKTIAQLKERKGESASQEGNSDVSALLPCGLLLNACALMLENSVSHPIKITVQLLAILFMLIGIYQTAQSRRK